MSRKQNFIRLLKSMGASERCSAILEMVGDACAELLDSEEFTRAADSTNALGWAIDEYEVNDIDYGEEECVISFRYSACGEEDEDNFFCGNGVAGEAVAVIDAEGHVTIREVTAEAYDRHAWADDADAGD